jgi:hypothetical protein
MLLVSHRLRLVIAAVCGFAYMATLQQGAMCVLPVLFGGEHKLQLVQEAGETELVFHHAHDDDDHSPLNQVVHLNHRHHHGDHIIKLLSHDDSLITSGSSLRLLPTSWAISWVANSRVVTPRYAFAPTMRARPPPLIGSGVLQCLRTTVLVV